MAHAVEVVNGAGAFITEFLLLVSCHVFPVFVTWVRDVVLWVHSFGC